MSLADFFDDFLKSHTNQEGVDMSRKRILAIHQHNCDEVKKVGPSRGVFNSTPDPISATQSLPKTPYINLRPISIAELQTSNVGQVTRGRVLYCRTIVDAGMMTAIFTVVEDQTLDKSKPQNEAPVARLMLYNYAPIIDVGLAADQKTPWQALPAHTNLVIIEPYMKIAKDGTLILRVDNPKLVGILPQVNSDKKKKKKKKKKATSNRTTVQPVQPESKPSADDQCDHDTAVASGHIQMAIGYLNPALCDFIKASLQLTVAAASTAVSKDQQQVLQAKLKKGDFAECLKIIRDYWAVLFSSHDKDSLKKTAQRCLQIRHLVSHQQMSTIEHLQRSLETIMQLAIC